LWEVIFVDDHSEDGSFLKLRTLLENSLLSGRGFYCLFLPPDKSGKKAALSYGIEYAKNDWIIQVDADCRIGTGFIVSHMSFLEKHPSDLVAGLVTSGRGDGNFLERFERLDLLSLSGSAAGSFGLGRPMMCSGANLAYSRELYMETRAFDPATSTASGDDMFLMIGARKLGKTLSFLMDRKSVAETRPVKDLRTLLAQRIRWGSKTTVYKMADIQWLAILVSLVNLIILFLPLWIILMAGAWPWLVGGVILKTFADFLLLYRITGATGHRIDLRLFIPASVVYYPIFAVTLVGALLGKPVWKRKIS
jgi:cellulose synthase/poly-beta-1,6-N-acetylglucosamine synthase-like glycosyltransferase